MVLILMAAGGDERKNDPLFHDFLGVSMSCDGRTPPRRLASKGGENGSAADAASASLRLSSSGYRGLVSSSSSLVSERQEMKSSEVFHFHGRKTALSGLEVDNTLSGNKRSCSGLVFPGPIDRVLPVCSDSFQSSFLVKRPRRPNPIILHPPGSIPDSPFSREGPPLPKGPGHQTSRFSQSGSCFDLAANSYAYKGANAILPIVSQSASDGSQEGIRKGRYLSIENPINITFEGNSTSFLHRPKSAQTIESEPSSILRSSTKAPAGRQMTIFYAGQAHVFDNVHPNKAHVIMTLAGLSSGSWSNAYPTRASEWMTVMTGEAPEQMIGVDQRVNDASFTQVAEPTTTATAAATTTTRDKRDA